MRAFAKAVLWAGSIVLLSSPAAAQQDGRPVCVDGSRGCLVKTAMIYLNGLVHHDASAIPFAPDVRATEQGSVVVSDARKFRSEIDSSTAITGARNVRLMVDQQTQAVAAFYVLDIAGENGKPAYSVWRGQRFRIVRGYVTEVEVYNYIEPDPRGIGAQLWPGGTRLPAGG
jgi:hypothetical protein